MSGSAFNSIGLINSVNGQTGNVTISLQSVTDFGNVTTNPIGLFDAANGVAGYISLNDGQMSFTGANIDGVTFSFGPHLSILDFGSQTAARDYAFQDVSGIIAMVGDSVTSVSGTLNRITSSGGLTPTIDISSSYVGQSSITTVGTLTSGASGAGFTLNFGSSTLSGRVPFTNISQFAANSVATNSTTGTADLSATLLSASNLLGRGSTGNVAAITLGSGITMTGTVLSATGTGGTVTTVSVVSTNGFAGTVATATTTPAITISTTITGLLKGNGTAVSAASAGTDYQAPISLTTTGTSGAATFISNTINIPQYQAAGTYVTSVAGTTNRITSSGGTTPAIDIAATYVGQTSITTLGTIATGTWSATTISIAKGGTNATSQVNNGVNYFNGTSITSIATFNFDGTKLGIGAVADSVLTAAAQTTIVAPPSGTTIHLIGLDANSLRVTLDTHNNANAGGTAFIGRRSRGTATSPLATSSGDTIISFNGTGYGATGYGAASTGLITIKANQNFTDTAMGTYVTVFTTPDASVTAAEALRITGAGAVNAIQAAGVYQINSVNVLSSTTLGSGIISSSLTSVGTIVTGVWNGTAIANANLANSSLTIGSTNIALGATSTTLAGLTSVTSTTFVGALTGNADSASTISSANEATDTTCFPLFITASGTQTLQPKNNTSFVFNANTGELGATNLTAGAAGIIAFSASSNIKAPSDGILTLLNNAGTAFTRLQLGGTTSSFPSIKRNGTGIDIRLADDSAFASLQATTITGTIGTFTQSGAGTTLAVTNSRSSASNIGMLVQTTGNGTNGTALQAQVTLGTNRISCILGAGATPTGIWDLYATTSAANNAIVGKTSFGMLTAPTAHVNIAAGTTAIAPFLLTSGTNLTTAVAGSMEYDGTNLYFTPTGTTRQTLAYLGLAQTFTANQTFSANVIMSGATSVIRLKGYTVATLPAGTQGDTAFVTDSLAPTFLATVVGGGAIVTTVFYNGTSWVAQ